MSAARGRASGRRARGRAPRGPRPRPARSRPAVRPGRRRPRRSRGVVGGRGRGAAVGGGRGRDSSSPAKKVWSPTGHSPQTLHSSQPSASSIRVALGPVAALDPVPVGDRRHARAKCWATASWSAASRLAANPPACRSSSCSAASRATEIPTSGGSSESESSVPMVRPSRSPSASTVTTATPEGKRRISARRSSPATTSSMFEGQATISGAPTRRKRAAPSSLRCLFGAVLVGFAALPWAAQAPAQGAPAVVVYPSSQSITASGRLPPGAKRGLVYNAAIGEREGALLVVRAARRISVAVEGPSGGNLPVRLFFARFASAGRRQVPDALEPWDGSTRAAEKTNQPVLVQVEVPYGTPPGSYVGALTVTADGRAARLPSGSGSSR